MTRSKIKFYIIFIFLMFLFWERGNLFYKVSIIFNQYNNINLIYKQYILMISVTLVPLPADERFLIITFFALMHEIWIFALKMNLLPQFST